MPRGKEAPVGSTRVSPNGYHYTKIPGKWELTARIVKGEERGYPLTENERLRCLGDDRLNLDPSNWEVYEVKEKSTKSKKDILRAKIEDLQAELDALEEEDPS